jgi:hypothetical protein
MSDLLFFLRFFKLLKLFPSQTPVKRRKSNAQRVIEKALERYRTEATEMVKQDLCAECRDRRCDRGICCKAFEESIQETAWEMVSAENN